VECGHNINLAVSHSLQRKATEADAGHSESIADIQALVNVCKDIVTRVKRTQMQHELSTTLKQSVSTRWNSTLFMLKSICDNLEQLKTMTERSTF